VGHKVVLSSNLFLIIHYPVKKRKGERIRPFFLLTEYTYWKHEIRPVSQSYSTLSL